MNTHETNDAQVKPDGAAIACTEQRLATEIATLKAEAALKSAGRDDQATAVKIVEAVNDLFYVVHDRRTRQIEAVLKHLAQEVERQQKELTAERAEAERLAARQLAIYKWCERRITKECEDIEEMLEHIYERLTGANEEAERLRERVAELERIESHLCKELGGEIEARDVNAKYCTEAREENARLRSELAIRDTEMQVQADLVSASFARTLETELQQANARERDLKDELEKWKSSFQREAASALQWQASSVKATQEHHEIRKGLDAELARLKAENARLAAAKSKDWERGYFCAVALLLKYDGMVEPITAELFRGGGDWRNADPEDREEFIKHQGDLAMRSGGEGKVKS